MSPIDALLTRALLLDDPYVPQDVVPLQESAPPPPPDTAAPEAADRDQEQVRTNAASDLQTLCEVLVAATPASALRAFVTEQLPGPAGALALGCIVQMADADDSARFWWQYAAGAGDQAAAYCLHLHHLSLGERDVATWWWQQAIALDICPTQPGAPPSGPRPGPQDQRLDLAELDTDASTPTLLRVLRILSHWSGRPRTEAVTALLHYVPTAVAVGYLNDEPDIDLPMPGPDFADHISSLLAATISKPARPPRRATTPRLPGRPGRPRTGTDPVEHGRTREHPDYEETCGSHPTHVRH